MPEVKELVEGIAKDFEEFKKANDARLKLLEEGKDVPAELEQKLEKIEESISSQEAQKERLDRIETAIKRGNLGGGSQDDEAKEEAKEYGKLFSKYLRNGDDRGGLSQKEVARASELQQKLLAVQSDPDGGYWVSPDQTGRMVEKIFETSPMRQAASVQTISTDALEGPYDDDEAGAQWVGETQSPTDQTTPQVKVWRIPVHELATRPQATQKLLEDAAVDVEAWLSNKVARKFSRTENEAFVLGDGVGKPRGFLDYPAASSLEAVERGKIGRLESGTASVVEFDDLMDLQGALKTEYEVNSRWAMNRRTRTDVRKLKDEDGQYLWEPALQGGEPALLLGRPIIPFEDMPDVADDSLPIAIADWAETYQIVDRLGISVLRDPYTAKPFVEFYTRKRTGGDVLNFDSIKLLQIQAAP